jgi:hypothetical protein
MFPFGNTNFNGSNFSGFGYGFNSNHKISAYMDFDNNNFAGDWSGGVNTEPSNPAAELDPFGLGPIAFPEAYPQAGPSRSQDLISGPSYWEAAAPYEGSTVLDTAANTLSYPYETMFPPTNSIPGTGKSYRENLDRRSIADGRPRKRLWSQLVHGVELGGYHTGPRTSPLGGDLRATHPHPVLEVEFGVRDLDH